MNRDEVLNEFEKQLQNGHRLRDRMDKNVDFKSFSKQQMMAMLDLKFMGKSKLKDVAEKSGISSQYLCIMFNNLEKEGLVAREIDDNDRRNTYYSITESGIKKLDDKIDEIKASLANLLDDMDDRDVEEFGKALRTMNKIMEEYF